MRTGKIVFRALLIVSLALFGVIIGNHIESARGDQTTNTTCKSGCNCSNSGQLGGTSCAAGVWCQGSGDASFWGCASNPNTNCQGNSNLYGFTNCVGTCNDGSGKECNFDVSHCK
jgi:hypothetical protein